MTFDVEEVLSKLSNGEKASLLSGMSSIFLLPYPPVTTSLLLLLHHLLVNYLFATRN